MSLSSIRPRCGRQGLLRRSFAVVGSLAIVLVTMVSLPWATPPAGAATVDLDVPLGGTSVQISHVRNTEGVDPITDRDGASERSALPWEWGSSRSCIRYSPAGGDYSTDVVKGGAAESMSLSATGGRDAAGARTTRAGLPRVASPPWASSPPAPRPSKSARCFLSGR